MEYSNIEKAAIVCLLIELINADKTVALDERYIFNQICNELAVTQDIFDAGKSMDMDYAVVVVKHMNEDQKMAIAVLMTRIIDADGGVHDKELSVLNKI